MNISHLLHSLLLLCVVIMANPVKAGTPGKVLFVGNSFSFYNNGIHNHYANLIRASGEWSSPTNRTRLLTLSGGHIYEHLSGLMDYLSEDTRGWDAVVLQGHSNEPIHTKKQKRFEESIAQAIKLIRNKKLEPLLFMTWGYKGDETMGQQIIHAYIAQAQKHNARVIPVGLAFAEAEKTLPEVELFVPDILGVENTDDANQLTYRTDWKHPSAAGTYLAACVFYASLQGKSPEGNLFTSVLTQEVAHKLQVLSWQIVSEFNRHKSNENAK